MAGLNGRGHSHTGAYLGMKGVEIIHLIDPDSRTFAKHLKNIEGKTAEDIVKEVFDDIAADYEARLPKP